MYKSKFVILLLIHQTIAFCQDQNLDNYKIDEEDTIMLYTPKHFLTKDTINSRILNEVRNIATLRMVYIIQNKLHLNELEYDILEKKIDRMALAFYLEGKPIIIERINGFYGRPDGYIKKEPCNGINVTTINFTYNCQDTFRKYEEKFIEIFNNRTMKLLAARKNY